MNDGNVSRKRSSHVFFAASVACALAAGCGDTSAAVPGLDGCVRPAQGYGLCYETLGQKPSPLEKMMGSPGVSVRIFGRAQGRPVALITSNGGADIPDAWREQYGRPDCYARNIDFQDVRRQLAERPVSADLAVHKRRVLAMVAAVERDYLENPMFAGTSCEGVTADNMVTLVEQQHALARQQSETLAATGGAAPASAAKQGPAALSLRLPPWSYGEADAWEIVWGRSITGAGPRPLRIEVARETLGPNPAVAARVASGPSSEVTLIIDAPRSLLPAQWRCPAKDYDEHMADVDPDGMLVAAASIDAQAGRSPWAMFASRVASHLAQTRRDELDVGRGDAEGSLSEEESASLDRLFSSGSGRKNGQSLGERMRHRGYRAPQGRPGVLYRTSLDIFAQPLPGPFSWLGIHSGTRTHVVRSFDGVHWEAERDEQTCNHGACPDDPAETGFQHRGTCAPEVVTSGWYGFDGECSGRWGPLGRDHLCNDDTALQINNAFGRWSGDHCAHRHRKHTPACQMHW